MRVGFREREGEEVGCQVGGDGFDGLVGGGSDELKRKESRGQIDDT